MRGEIVAVDFTEAEYTTITVRVPPGEQLGHWFVEVTPVDGRRLSKLTPPAAGTLTLPIKLGRTSVGIGTVVQVTPSAPRKHDGFLAPILDIHDTNPVTVDVRDPKSGNLRTIPVTRLKAKRKPRA